MGKGIDLGNGSGEEGRCGSGGTCFLIKDSVLFCLIHVHALGSKQLTEYLT